MTSPNRVMKKIKLATQDKSEKCSINKCGKLGAQRVPVDNGNRLLCVKHFEIWQSRSVHFQPEFMKASEMI